MNNGFIQDGQSIHIEHICSIVYFSFSVLLHIENVKDKLYLKRLGNRIRTLRKEKGLSQLDLGVSMDNYAEQISRIERGQLNVSI